VASAEQLLKLRAGSASGPEVPNGSLVNLGLQEEPEYIFTTQVTISGTGAPKEIEVECENYLQQARVEESGDTVRFAQTHSVEICEGEWLEEGIFQTTITLTGPGSATAESTMNLYRDEEEVRKEEREQAERGEEVEPRNPLRCNYITQRAKGKYKSTVKKPLLVKIKSKMLLNPSGSDPGCGQKGKWKGVFNVKYKGQPVFLVTETTAPPPPPPGPTVTEVTPKTGPEAGGTEVTITGAHFTPGSKVFFGANEATVKTESETSITATSPPGTGTVEVTVHNENGTSPSTPNDEFTYTAAMA
jgi:hypothetical protein